VDHGPDRRRPTQWLDATRKNGVSSDGRSSKCPGGQWGVNSLSGFEAKAHLAQITQDRSHGPCGRIGQKRSGPVPCPGPRLNLKWRRGDGALSIDQDSVDIKEEACITRISGGNPTIRVCLRLTLTIKEMAQKWACGHADRKCLNSWASFRRSSQQSEKQPGGLPLKRGHRIATLIKRTIQHHAD